MRKAAAAHGGSLELIELDLANLKSVRACADALLTKGDLFDVVIANAGVMATPLGHTTDGFETQFGTNHLGHFVFVNKIAPLIREGGRLINLASSGHRFANVDLEDPNFERTPYEPFVAYGRSKTANILFAVAFDTRHRGRGVPRGGGPPRCHQDRIGPPYGRRALPGDAGGESTSNWPKRERDRSSSRASPKARQPLSGRESSHLPMKSVGKYCENCHVGEIVPDDRVITPISEGVRAYALDPVAAEALWKKSEAMVGEKFLRPIG